MPRRAAAYLSVILAGLFFAEWLIPIDTAADLATSYPTPHWQSVSDITAPPNLRTDRLAHAPLFDPSRRADEPESGAPEPEAAPDDDSPIAKRLTLLGVVETGGARFAIVHDQGAAQSSRISVGATIAGWQVDSILADRVVLKSGGRKEEVAFHYGASSP